MISEREEAVRSVESKFSDLVLTLFSPLHFTSIFVNHVLLSNREEEKKHIFFKPVRGPPLVLPQWSFVLLVLLLPFEALGTPYSVPNRVLLPQGTYHEPMP